MDVSLQHSRGAGRGGRAGLLESEGGGVHGETPPAGLPRDYREDLPPTLSERYKHALALLYWMIFLPYFATPFCDSGPFIIIYIYIYKAVQ